MRILAEREERNGSLEVDSKKSVLPSPASGTVDRTPFEKVKQYVGNPFLI